ncbi:hypothetical protein ACFE04_010121 [Oxalis oulophora]
MDHLQKPIKDCPILSPVLFQTLEKVPSQFRWPQSALIPPSNHQLNSPVIDLQGLYNGDQASIKKSTDLIKSACLTHGCFEVINHGVDENLIRSAVEISNEFFDLPMDQKFKAMKTPENPWGYSAAHSERFSSKLQWKETFSVQFYQDLMNPVVVEFFKEKLGKDHEQQGWVFQEYCEAMHKLGLAIMELLAISLGIDRLHYKKFFEDACSIMRSNYYPWCPEPDSTVGIAPHCDPVSLAILHQDDVGGLEVFSDNKWQTVPPRPGSLIVNIGDTFVALSNGKYKSCLHRVVANKEKERKSIVFFFSPKKDKTVRAPDELVVKDGVKMFPDFTWSQFFEFTYSKYRTDGDTLKAFVEWLSTSKTGHDDDAAKN